MTSTSTVNGRRSRRECLGEVGTAVPLLGEDTSDNEMTQESTKQVSS